MPDDRDDVRESLGLAPSTIDTAECKIRGADGRWYKVPQPVLVQHMVTLGLSSAAVRGRLPHLIRPGEARGGATSSASDDNFALLATDELLAKVTTYLESGELERLCDVADLCETLAGVRNVTADDFAAMRRARVRALGDYDERVVLHPQEA